MRKFLLVSLVLIWICAPGVSRGAELKTMPNSASFVDVTCADGVFVKNALIAGKSDPQSAKQNTECMHELTSSGRVGAHAVFYFPAGDYYFDGAVSGASASIESSAAYQTFAGADMNASRILQLNREVDATIRMAHDACTVRDLYVGSADNGAQWSEDWEDNPHQAAIHLDGPQVLGGKWPVDPKIEKVNINSLGNTINIHGFSRPFRAGIRVTGAWLNIYVHNVWMTDLYTGIDVCQGPVMAGPAKFIDVNFYGTHEREKSKIWSTFFRSETHFMEQVELIHCTFIGAQFIYMDGSGQQDNPFTDLTPAYNMVIDHNYINVVDTFAAPQAKSPDPKYSGIYMNLPPKDMGDGTLSYSRDIRITNNSCTGRAPENGGFFYFAGMCRGILINANEMACAVQPRCFVIEPMAQPPDFLKDKESFIAIRDVRITNNYIRTFEKLVSIGQNLSLGDPQPRVKHVLISNNQTMFEAAAYRGRGVIEISRCEDVCVQANQFGAGGGWGVKLARVNDANILGNVFEGIGAEASPAGVLLQNADGVSVLGNTIRNFGTGVQLQDSQGCNLSNNVVRACAVGINTGKSTDVVILGNQLEVSSAAIQSDPAATLREGENAVRVISND